MTRICDNCHTEYYDQEETTSSASFSVVKVVHVKECASCTNGYDIPDKENEDSNET